MKVTNEWMKEQLLNVMMEQCPYEIPDSEEEIAKDVLRGIVFGKDDMESDRL